MAVPSEQFEIIQSPKCVSLSHIDYTGVPFIPLEIVQLGSEGLDEVICIIHPVIQGLPGLLDLRLCRTVCIARDYSPRVRAGPLDLCLVGRDSKQAGQMISVGPVLSHIAIYAQQHRLDFRTVVHIFLFLHLDIVDLIQRAGHRGQCKSRKQYQCLYIFHICHSI